jgi:hypothetical protein
VRNQFAQENTAANGRAEGIQGKGWGRWVQIPHFPVQRFSDLRILRPTGHFVKKKTKKETVVPAQRSTAYLLQEGYFLNDIDFSAIVIITGNFQDLKNCTNILFI